MRTAVPYQHAPPADHSNQSADSHGFARQIAGSACLSFSVQQV